MCLRAPCNYHRCIVFDGARVLAALERLPHFWKEVDSDIPILRQAKAEHANSTVSAASEVRDVMSG